jgi:hypothetical protein
MPASSARPLLPVFLTVAGLGLAGCASGGGGGGVAAAPPSPPPGPTATTFVSQSAQSLYLISVNGIGGTDIQGGASQATGAGPNITVTITDANGASTLGALKFDGHQTVQVQYSDNRFNQTYLPGNFVATPAHDPRSGISASARTVALSSWEASTANTTAGFPNNISGFYIFDLRKNGLGTPPIYAKLSETQASISGPVNNILDSFQLIGAPTADADMPHTGSATFTGESFGRLIAGGNTPGTPFLATATLNVDFTKTTGAITGAINNTAQSSAADPLRFNMTFTADVSGSKFGGAATAANAATGTALGTGMTGNVQGAFYGPTAAAAVEAGGTFALQGAAPASGPANALVGGFITGR